jgi:hypothetical protein
VPSRQEFPASAGYYWNKVHKRFASTFLRNRGRSPIKNASRRSIEPDATYSEKNQAAKRKTEVQPAEKELATLIREHAESKKQERSGKQPSMTAERFQRILNLDQLGRTGALLVDAGTASGERRDTARPSPTFLVNVALSRRLLGCYAASTVRAVLFCTVLKISACYLEVGQERFPVRRRLCSRYEIHEEREQTAH